MAYTFSVNNSPATGGVALYLLISTLVSAGWTKAMDSDGTTYSSSGAQVTSGATGAGGLNNSNAWVRLSAPAVNGQVRELTFQRGATALQWRIKYSASALFSGGSPAATVTPSSADEVFMAGGGTDASPTFLSWLGTDALYRWHVACGGAAEGYSFVAWSMAIGLLGTLTNAIALDVMAPGSYPTTDVDPAVMYCSAASAGNTAISELVSTAFSSVNVTNPALARAWLGATSAAGASLVANSMNARIVCYGTSVVGNSVTLASNPWTNKDDLLPCLWGSKVTGGPCQGLKGFSTLFMIGTVHRVNMTISDSTDVNARDKIYFGGLWLPWSGADALI